MEDELPQVPPQGDILRTTARHETATRIPAKGKFCSQPADEGETMEARSAMPPQFTTCVII